jgi:hypothetical protein
MKLLLRVILVVTLACIALGLDVTLWNAWRSGHPHGGAIMGVVGRRGVSSVDPLSALTSFTAIINAIFFMVFFSFSFPWAVGRTKQRLAGSGPPENPPSPPTWTCRHCHEENPGNFEECWKCQRNRPSEETKGG